MPDPETPVGAVERATFAAERARLEETLKALADEAQKELERLTQNGKEMTAVFKSAAFKKALTANDDLAPIVERSRETLAKDTAAANEAVTSIEARRRTIARDLDKLAILLR